MSKNLWFAGGFAAAWLLVAIALWAPLGDIVAEQGWLRSHPTLASPAFSTPAPIPTAAPTPTPGLAWRYQGPGANDCGHLLIDAGGVVRYAVGESALLVALLTTDELVAYHQAQSTLRTIDYAVQPVTGGSEYCRFSGVGSGTATLGQQQELARWAEGVYRRLVEQEMREDQVAAARLHLAFLRDRPVDEIETLAVCEETWPDACLGIVREGMGCAMVLTPGYRVELALAGVRYEYRSDLHGRLLLATDLGSADTQAEG